MTKLKVGFIPTISHPLQKGTKGWARYAYFLAKQLDQNDDIDLTIFGTDNSSKREFQNFVTTLPYELTNPNLAQPHKAWEMQQLSEAFSSEYDFDVIHSWYTWEHLPFAKLQMTSTLGTFHGIATKDKPVIDKLFSDLPDHIWFNAISDDNRSWHPELPWAGTTYHGIDLDDFKFNPEPDHYLFMAARICAEKGITQAIEIANQTNLKLIIAGQIYDQDYYQNKVEPLLNNQIQYVGEVGYQEVIERFSNAKASLHLPQPPFREAFGMTLIESMAVGTPIIAMCNGSIPEIVQGGKTGFVVNSIDEAVESVGKINQINRQACRTGVADKFSWSKVADRYVEIYKTIVN
jgi:glycosyltransferase involved in cell wall biosynthesis